jgi:ATP-dependent Lon protease
MSDSSVINMLKDYMESGSFARGKEEVPAEASVVLIGNTSKPHTDLVRTAHLFADLPTAMIDPAFLDRLHYYLPGWETPKLESRLFTNHFGFVSDYFAESLRQLRKDSYVRAIDQDFALGDQLSARDEKAVRKTVSGLLKILHPHGEWTRSELREYLEFALEGRRRIKEQLKKLAAHDYAKTAFSYIERDTGHEYWVDLPEQPDEAESTLAEQAEEAGSEPLPKLTSGSVRDLIARGEGRYIEFKKTGRFNAHTGQKDPLLEHMVVKAVAGFLNAAGGVLLIGVTDTGEVTGIEDDLATLGRKGTLDGYALWLSNLLDHRMGPVATAGVEITFDALDTATVCRVEVQASSAPAFVKTVKGETELFVRLNNSTRALNIAEALDYVRRHWG